MLKLIKLMTQSAFEKSAAAQIASEKIKKFTKETLRFTEELYFFAPMGEMARCPTIALVAWTRQHQTAAQAA